MKYAHIEENGKILGWYDDTIHTLIPSPTIEISEEQWSIAVNDCHNKANNDGTTEKYDFRSIDEIEAQILEAKQIEAQSYLDSTDWIKSKYVELVVMKKTMTEEEFNLKYEVELAKMDEARSIL